MGGKSFTRYYRDPQFRAEVDEQFARADAAAADGEWITYAIHNPTVADRVGERPEGPIIYVGQSKEFAKRVRKRMRNAGIAIRRPTDRIDGACYDIMCQGRAPHFSILEKTTTAIDSLISETNWTKRLRSAGYTLLNQWTEQKFGGSEIERHTVPHDWIWPLTAADAVGSGIDLIVSDGASELLADMTSFPPKTRLREIRELLKGQGKRSRLHVR